MLPTMITDRLILQPRTMDDLDECVKMDKDPEVTEYIPGVWDGSEKHIIFLKDRIRKPYPKGLGYWSVFSKDEPTCFLGWVHLLSSPDDECITEIGWRLKRSAGGYGYATEAARAVLTYAFEIILSEQVIAVTHTDNMRSKKVMERIDMRYVSEFIYEDSIPSVLYKSSVKGM